MDILKKPESFLVANFLTVLLGKIEKKVMAWGMFIKMNIQEAWIQ